MQAEALDYSLPPELIAQRAAEPRDSARLLVFERSTGAVRHRVFRDLPEELDPSDLVVVNDTRVLPVRIRARRETGGSAEVLLLEPDSAGGWEALVRPYRRLRIGEQLRSGGLAVTIAERLGEGRARVRLEADGELERALELAGEMPLPPYITAPLDDPSRYQTVYAREPGSAAAPTAGLHFTDELWQRLRARNQVVEVTLDVGLDTFRPLTADVVEEHRIHSERYTVSEAAASTVEAALADGRRIVAVGTTTVRVLETVFADPRGPLQGRSRLLITPGHRFRATGAMVTNFHLPRSTLLALVMAFAGEQPTRDLYRTAVRERYRFYSFGDASLIL